MYVYAKSVNGLRSNINEDSIYIPENGNEKRLYILCDGMGGHPDGEVASQLCISKFKEYHSESESLLTTTKRVNESLRQYSKEHPNSAGMGTTLVALILNKRNAEIVSVGDSRVYLITPKDFEQLTEDQSPVWELFSQGVITKDEMITHSRKNILSEALGIHEEPQINLYKIFYPTEQWIFLLCSDGLTDVTTDDEIHEAIKDINSLKEGVEKLGRLAIQNLSRDDISIILVSNYIKAV